jgi:hypothetical protein
MAVVVEHKSPEDRISVVRFTYRRPSTGRKVSKTLRFNQTLTSEHSGKLIPEASLRRHIDQMVGRRVFSPEFIENTPGAVIKSQIMRNLRSAPSRRRLAAEEADSAAREAGVPEFPPEEGGRPPWGEGRDRGRLFAPTLLPAGERSERSETGKSMLLVGSSFSGKTHLYVDELNKLDPGEYDAVIVMTESRYAPPLQRIREDLDVIVLEGFRPEVVAELKELNDQTENRFRWLIILDDIVDQKHSKVLSKMLLTYRNANVTTALVVQYPALVNKSSRGSLHAVVITGFRSLEDWELAGKIFDLLEWAKDEMVAQDIELVRSKLRKSDVYRWLKERTSMPGAVLYLDQKHSREPVLWSVIT